MAGARITAELSNHLKTIKVGHANID